MATITYEQLSARLDELALPIRADALHGAIVGLACAGIESNQAIWREHLSECLDGVDLEEHSDMMHALQVLVARDLADGELGFQLLLPDSEEFLSVRAKSLACWCENFVCGFVAVARELSDEDREVLADIAEISQLDDGESLEEADKRRSELNNPENADSNERDFIELGEYVRLAAMDLYRDSGAIEKNALPRVARDETET